MLTWTVQSLTWQILQENTFLKLWMWFFLYFVERFIIPDKHLLALIILVYIVDMFTGSVKALSVHNFSSRRFFRGLMKLWVYGILMVLAFGLDAVILDQHIFTNLMIAFIVINDAISILENLNELWFQTPLFLQQFLKSYSERFITSKLQSIDSTAFKSTDYLADVKDILKTYIPKIKDENLQKMMQIKVAQWAVTIQRIQAIDPNDFDIFKRKFILLVSEALKDIDSMLEREWFTQDIIQQFNDKQNPSVQKFIVWIDWTINSDELNSWWTNAEMKKNSILKELILIIYQATTEVLNHDGSYLSPKQ